MKRQPQPATGRSLWVTKRDRAKYLSGMEWAVIIDALLLQPDMVSRLLARELADRGLADN